MSEPVEWPETLNTTVEQCLLAQTLTVYSHVNIPIIIWSLLHLGILYNFTASG